MGSKQMEMCSFREEQDDESSKKDIIHVPTGQIHDFRGHPFKVERDMALFELMQSIGKEGVIVPALVRPNPYGEGYEMIAGHRRKEACLWAGIGEMPVVVRNLDDNQAVIAMVDSNLQREYLKPSEKAFAYKMKLEAMKHQGKRFIQNDVRGIGCNNGEAANKEETDFVSKYNKDMVCDRDKEDDCMREYKVNGVLILVCDNGYGNTKGAHVVFRTSVDVSDTPPAFSKDYLEHKGKYYILSEGHKSFVADKVMDDDTYILTLATIAKELKMRGLHEAKIHLAVGFH